MLTISLVQPRRKNKQTNFMNFSTKYMLNYAVFFKYNAIYKTCVHIRLKLFCVRSQLENKSSTFFTPAEAHYHTIAIKIQKQRAYVQAFFMTHPVGVSPQGRESDGDVCEKLQPRRLTRFRTRASILAVKTHCTSY